MQNSTGEKLVQAYHTMMERIKNTLGTAGQDGLSNLQQHIDKAIDKAVEMDELSREEAVKVGDYLRRDVHHAAEYLVDSRKELGDWMRFDLELIEARVLDMFSLMVDHTREELDKLTERAKAMSEWHTGEITGPGSLKCNACGKIVHYHKPGRIPPCPSCYNTAYTRLDDEEGNAAG